MSDHLPILAATVTIIYDPDDYYSQVSDFTAEEWRDYVEMLSLEDFNGASEMIPELSEIVLSDPIEDKPAIDTIPLF